MINRESFRRGLLPRLSVLQPFRLAWGSGLALLSALALTLPQSAMAAGTGTIEGRVQNADTGTYLNNARVTVEGTNVEAFTNAAGEYRLTNVPEGTAKVDVFYTGLNTQTLNVNVVGGQTATQDVNLSAVATKEGEVVKLDQFIVQAQRDTNQRTIAINEQRFAPNIETVVSSDQFGHVAEGNLGQFMKFMPGVSVDYVASDVRTIAMRGIGPNYTEVSVDNYRVAAANSGNTSAGRTVELEQISINNTARNEIVKTRTPDLSA
ncbi:MAG: carboxypeptidase regulatory-like domain-containing protein, partial [Verrucomicrobiota bacterium]|nr:carboxypeptidase regulatory-like domain-containing protein [Verrucomicrobiota bacterium]